MNHDRGSPTMAIRWPTPKTTASCRDGRPSLIGFVYHSSSCRAIRWNFPDLTGLILTRYLLVFAKDVLMYARYFFANR